MGKRRKGGNYAKRGIAGDKATREPDRTLLDPSSRSFVYDEVDDFEDEEDKNSLNYAKKYMPKKRESKEQVLGIGGSSSEEESEDDDDEDEDEDDYKNADDDDENDDELLMGNDDIYDEKVEKDIDERAWGEKKRSYFGTDTTDEKILKKLKNKNEELARLEEETARRLQDRLAQELAHLPEDDLLPQDDDTTEKDKIIPSSVEMDLTGLSRSKKLQLLKRESPEFLPLMEDIKDKSEELRKLYCPLMAAIKDSQISDGSLRQYIITKYRILYNYVTVLSVYMMTRCEQGSTASRHPVIARLTQYRQLLQELEPCDKAYGEHLEKMLADISTRKTKAAATKTVKSNKRKKTLGILSKNKTSKTDKEKKLSSMLDESEEEEDNVKEKKMKEDEDSNWKEDNDSDSDDEKKNKEVEEGLDSGIMDADERRGISYKIQKNKGLMPSRKKEQRNPRVKYKKKYQTKMKRRKGQVREVRKELKRYDGETTGIKSHLIKSVKIK